jgi:hypothetical protein
MPAGLILFLHKTLRLVGILFLWNTRTITLFMIASNRSRDLFCAMKDFEGITNSISRDSIEHGLNVQ